ncbi:IMP cyclohydrolase [Bacillus sp. FJAT-28004]|uniref:IMP cyclohydrolase n=1 Tax=Bacillus sp. FJAT-28004 TaxID=1679165 RepID=UPI0007C71B26|nr:IMP cyclohydrolase [Bacillus sp. FJAT-28004]
MHSFENQLFDDPYPGRTIIVGMSPSGKHYVQVYWIMGRSANSRNRIFERDQQFVRNTAYDAAKMEDPSLIIYYPIKNINGMHIISNGDQTDTIYAGYVKGKSFEDSLKSREFEPDAPHYTPRISGVIDTQSETYILSILKTRQNDPSVCIRHFFHYNPFTKGTGHCLHTYKGEGKGVLRPFDGEPLEVPLFDSMDETAQFYWSNINVDNKISLLIKFISTQDRTAEFKIMNKNQTF